MCDFITTGIVRNVFTYGVGEFCGIPGGPQVLAVVVKGTVSTGKELQQAELFNEIKSVYLQFKTD